MNTISKIQNTKRRFELAGCDIPTDDQIVEMTAIQEKYYAAGIYGNVDIVDFIIKIQTDKKIRKE